MQKTESYSTIEDIYDLFYFEEPDVRYYLQEAKKAAGKVLEIGCGTGRVMLKLLRNNIDVEGLDVSRKMIEILKNKARIQNLKPKTYVADMRNFSLKSRYSLILAPYRTFMYLSSEKERLNTLRRIYRHLTKNGKTIIHTYNPSALEIKSVGAFQPFDVSFFRLNGKEITALWYVKYSPIKKELTYRISLAGARGKPRHFDTRIYPASYDEMKKLLRKAGFKNIKTYSDFGGTPFNPAYKRIQGDLIWVAEK